LALLAKQKYTNVFLWWRSTLNRLVQVSKEFARWQVNLKREQLHYYQTLLTEAVRAFVEGTIPIDQVRKLQAMLLQLYAINKKGVQVRSKFFANGFHENPTFFHIQKERKRGGRKYIKSFSTELGEQVHGKEIYPAIYQQYRSMFAMVPIQTQSIDTLLVDGLMPVLSPDDRADLAVPFTIEEVSQALRLVNHKATAGVTGFNTQWVWHFKALLVPELVNVFNYIWTHYKSDMLFWQSIGIMLAKNQDVTSISNSRLIHLFNFEYKILTKCLQLRIMKCIMPILHPNQCGLPTSPPISVILAQLREVIHHAHLFNEEHAAILTLDISRAFDDL
jgi:hypothetical protein